MRKIFLYFSLLLFMQTAFAADSLFVRKPQIPILIDRTDNILVEMRVQAHKGDVLNKLSLQFKEGIDLNDIKALRFFYSGTEATSRQGKHYRPVSYISSHAEGKTKAANPAYSIKQSEVTDIANVVTFTSNQPMVEGVNYYWISIEMKPEASLLTTFTVRCRWLKSIICRRQLSGTANQMSAAWESVSATPVMTGLRPTVSRGW